MFTLERKGHKVSVVARGQESILQLLDRYNIQYATYGKSSKTKYGKVLQLPFQFLRAFGLTRKFRPDILVGTGTIEANIAAFLRKPCIIFDDSEPVHFLERSSWRYVTTVILTPSCFRKDLGKKQVRSPAKRN